MTSGKVNRKWRKDCDTMLYLWLSNFRENVFLCCVLEIYWLFRQKQI